MYLDDITYGAIFSMMLQYLLMIFTLFRSANLYLTLSKCFFGYEKVAYLVSGNRVEVYPEKIRAEVISKTDNNDAGTKLFGTSKLLQAFHSELSKDSFAIAKADLSDHLLNGTRDAR